MADGELTAREAERVEWDVIVVGTGMGGGMLGYRLARSGRQVLFVEKGRSTLPGTPGTIRSAMPELAEPRAARSAERLLRRLGPGRTLDRRGRRHQRALLEAVCAVHRQRNRRILGAVRHGLRAILRSRFHSPAEFPRPRRFHRAGGLAGHLRPDATLVRGSREAARSSRPARSAAAGGGRRRSACGATVFGRQPAAGRLPGRSRIASLSPADGLRLHRRLRHLSDLSLPAGRARTTPPAMACCRPSPSTVLSC